MMPRDMAIIRDLMLYLEKQPGGISTDEIELDLDDDVINYHLRLLGEADLLQVQVMRGGVIVHRMTWAGHDFVDSCRDDGIWKRAHRSIKKTAKSVSFALLLEILKQEAKQLL